jgi:hypothetical protein
MISELYSLIHSLSSVERKMFILNSKSTEGDKDYLELYDLILNKKIDHINQIKETFVKKYPDKSFQNNVTYLFKSIIKTLILLRIGQDDWFAELYGLMVSQLCIERSLPNYALKVLRDIKIKAKNNQNQINSYYAERMELSILSDMNFIGLNESDLIERQMGLRNSITKIKHIQEQFSIFELLRIRTLNEPLLASKVNNKKIQDLILSEMAINSTNNKNMFISQKLHLMFQSFFLTRIENYKSAINVFHKLNQLFENNQKLWNNPPYDYLSVLDEILSILQTTSQVEEMEYFLSKLTKLCSPLYPEHFNREAKKAIFSHSFSKSILERNFEQAKLIAQEITFTHHLHINSKRDSELILWNSVLNSYLEKWDVVKKISSSFLVYVHQKNYERVGRLLNIIALYELKEFDTIDYTIRAYKRTFKNYPNLYEIEKTIFSLISVDIKKRGNSYKESFRKKQHNILLKESTENPEVHNYLLKYYDFIGWVHQTCSI